MCHYCPVISAIDRQLRICIAPTPPLRTCRKHCFAQFGRGRLAHRVCILYGQSVNECQTGGTKIETADAADCKVAPRLGERTVAQEALFYSFNLERHVPADHLLRSIDRFVDLSGIREHLRSFYSSAGRPSVDPELMIRMLIIGSPTSPDG